jgi:hypothetical protein
MCCARDPACLVCVMSLSGVRCKINRAGQHRPTVPVCWPLPASRATRHPCRSRSCRLLCLALLTCPLISSDHPCLAPCPLASRLAFFPYLTLSHLLSHSYQYRHTYSLVMMCGSPIDAQHLHTHHVSAGHSAVAANSDIRDQASDLRFQHSVVPVSSDRNVITRALISY